MDVQNTGAGNIVVNVIAAGGDVSITRMEQTLVSGSGNSTLTTENGTITVAASGYGVSTVGSGNITLDANDTGSDKALLINKAISSTTGVISLEADGAVTSAAVISTSGEGAININVK